jgi:hypothetical protein
MRNGIWLAFCLLLLYGRWNGQQKDNYARFPFWGTTLDVFTKSQEQKQRANKAGIYGPREFLFSQMFRCDLG